MSTAAVILAAGYSTRMGAPNKLSLEVDGEKILRRVVKSVLEVVDHAPVVVLGHESEDVANVVADLPVRLITNPDPSRGQSSSVNLGLREVGEADRTLVVLGDQPFLSARALDNLLRAHIENGEATITVPMRGKDRGNPIVIPAHLKASILGSGMNIGCGSFTRQNPELTSAYETTEPAFFFDVDTPEDLVRAQEFAATATPNDGRVKDEAH